jgi:hypothetical protein
MNGRRPPRLCIDLELEQPGIVALLAETYEDELRLRAWLRRSPQFRRLPELIERLLADLDDADRREAA